MVEELHKGMDNFSKETIITLLIFGFGILMFVAGYYLGEYTEYQKIYRDKETYCQDFHNLGYPLIVPQYLNVSFNSFLKHNSSLRMEGNQT